MCADTLKYSAGAVTMVVEDTWYSRPDTVHISAQIETIFIPGILSSTAVLAVMGPNLLNCTSTDRVLYYGWYLVSGWVLDRFRTAATHFVVHRCHSLNRSKRANMHVLNMMPSTDIMPETGFIHSRSIYTSCVVVFFFDTNWTFLVIWRRVKWTSWTWGWILRKGFICALIFS